MIKTITCYLMAAFYIFAGVNHFLDPDFYMKIMPPYLPYHLPLVYISGVFEIGLGVFLLPKVTRKRAAWGVILLLIAVFPANIYQFMSGGDGKIPEWVLILRLPLQFLAIAWAYVYTK